MKRRKLTPNQEKFLIENYPFRYAKDVAIDLGISLSSVYNYVHSLGLKKDPTFRREELNRQADRLRSLGTPGRFKKGIVPFNKGQKMSNEVYEKVKGTMFKKGQRPANWKPDGSERIDKDGYAMVKVNGKFILKHKHVWELVNGPMPKGHAVVFKDRNKFNFNIENLECITREQLMLRNTIHNYPSEIVGAMKLLANLKKKINAKEQN